VIKTAALPSAPSSPVPTTNLAIGALLGLTAGVTAAFVRQSLDTSVRSAADLKRLTSVPVLGALPYDRALKAAPLTLQGSPSASIDFYRQLRTTMELLDPERRCKRVAVASSVAGEGRTTLLCNLASAFGRADFRVLVVDADLRRPRVAKYLGLSSDVGLTNVALGDAPLDNAIQPWDRAVDVLTSGPVPADPGEVLASTAMGALLEEVGRRYDLVLIDTPPLRPVADGRIIATRCDASLLVIRRGRTNQAQVHEAVEELETWGARFLGIVLNMGHAPAAYGVPAAKPSRRRSLDGVSAWASLPASSGANAQDNASTNRNPGDSWTRD
jgi:non-specific protein-tyrosine kinase